MSQSLALLGRVLYAAVVLAFILGSTGYFNYEHAMAADDYRASFSMCGRAPHHNCVIDGDTFFLGANSIRIADIDAPETHPSRCAYEADLGAKATRRLLALLNVGPFTLKGFGSRDRDQYGRQVRIVLRDGRSLGGMLV